MKSKKRAILALLTVVLISGGITASLTRGKTPESVISAGTIVEHAGRKYRVETDEDLHRVRVYSDPDQKPYPTGIVLVLNRKDGPPRRIKLGISETTRDSVVYSGLVPSNVLISGGVTFQIKETK
jgi:hypothetical protein